MRVILSNFRKGLLKQKSKGEDIRYEHIMYEILAIATSTTCGHGSSLTLWCEQCQEAQCESCHKTHTKSKHIVGGSTQTDIIRKIKENPEKNQKLIKRLTSPKVQAHITKEIKDAKQRIIDLKKAAEDRKAAEALTKKKREVELKLVAEEKRKAEHTDD